MYAAVGSYLCQAWRRFDLRVTYYPALATTARGRRRSTRTSSPTTGSSTSACCSPSSGCSVLRRTHGALHRRRRAATGCRWPLSFVLIGLFLWLAENLATFLDAWKYPGQVDVWEAVHTSKIGSWALLVTHELRAGRHGEGAGGHGSTTSGGAGDERVSA